MAVKIAINGYGRIGRNILKALFESHRTNELEIVAINDLGDAESNAYLTQYDSAHGTFPFAVEAKDDALIIDGKDIKVFAERDPEQLPWADLGVEAVLECTGFFRTKELAGKHLTAGAKKVIISAPAGSEVDATIVYGVNHNILSKDDQIISNASCTTNCLAPIAKVLLESFGINSGLMTTIHAYTSDQRVHDFPHKDMRRARAAALSMIPTTTGAAVAVSSVLPELEGKLDGMAIRVPTANVSVVDLTVDLERKAGANEVNAALKEAAESNLNGILGYSELPLVSIDFNGCKLSSILDAPFTKVIEGGLVKVLSWYDNETGYSNRLVELTAKIL